MDFQPAGGAHARAVVDVAGEVAVEQVDAVELGGVGDAGDFRGHGLVLGVNNQTLVRIVGARGRLHGQLLHPDQLLVDHGQGPVPRSGSG